MTGAPVEPPVKPIEWLGDRARIIDQRLLPGTLAWMELRTADEMAAAIRNMALRGAPLIGIAAAMGLAAEAGRWADLPWGEFTAKIDRAIAVLRATRPTASNLFWALNRMGCALGTGGADPRAARERLVAEAIAIFEEDLETGRRMGETGAALIRDGATVLTHCNAGGLATSGYGTALAPMYVAHAQGRKFRVLADETRPLLQGARLTAWELARAGIDVTVICDSAAHFLLARGRAHIVFVGSDRITSSGDFANKIGTYGVALSAAAAKVPFYVVAPSSTIDFNLASGSEIPIEERDPAEVTELAGKRVVPEGVKAYNPAFDVTPRELVTGIITERGLATPPFEASLRRLHSE